MSNRFTRHITLDGENVTYILEYKSIKNVNIHCTPAKGLYISAPFHADLQKIDTYLKDNSERILDAVHKANSSSKRVGKHRSEQRSLTIGGRAVAYELNYKDVKRINLLISGDKGVRVSAPPSVKVGEIESFMLKNSAFIIRALDKYERLSQDMPTVKTYSDGEYIYFLGKPLTIRLFPSSRSYAEIRGDELHIHAADISNTCLKGSIVDAFLKSRCEETIPQMCRALYPRFEAKGIAYPKELRFRKMVSCWGNCRPSRSILTFSTHLIQLPEKCIEQVICHEFTHFIHANHSKAFYAQLAEFMPEWKKYDALTKQMQHEIIIRNSGGSSAADAN